MPKRLLEGVKLLDFSWALVGPVITKTFADYGATVIRIESSVRPDTFRTAPPGKDFIMGFERNVIFGNENTGKLSLTLNLIHPKAIEVAKRLVAWADIVVENFAGGTIGRIGLGYEAVKRIKPDIIMLSTCMQGQTGPNARHPGWGWQMSSLSGFCQITGWPDRKPAEVGVYTDFIAPHFGVVIILAALLHRQRTGKGQHIDLSQYEAGVHFIAPLVLDYALNHRIADRIGNRLAYAAPHNAYRCRGEDRWCAIAVFTDEEWEGFCRVIENPAWARDPRFSTILARKENEDELERLVEEWTINHTAEEVMTMMQMAGVPAGVLETAADLLENDLQLKHRQAFWELEHPELGRYHAKAPVFVLSKSRAELRRAPLLGEHNEYVLKEILGMSDEEIAELVVEGVLE